LGMLICRIAVVACARTYAQLCITFHDSAARLRRSGNCCARFSSGHIEPDRRIRARWGGECRNCRRRADQPFWSATPRGSSPAFGSWHPRCRRARRTRRPCGPMGVVGRCRVGAFDGAREGGACGDVHLVDDVAQVGLDCLLAQEQFRGDLRVGLAVDDEPRDLEFAPGQRVDACPVGLARPGAPVGTMAELSQLSLGALAVAPRAASVERYRRALKFGHGAIFFVGFGERLARYRARQGGFDRGPGSVGRIGRG
jgi:hypothetical protein